MSIDPIRTSQAVAEAYYGYLCTTFQFSDERLSEQFKAGLRQKDKYVKGPIVQATPPFKKSLTLNDLVDEGVLSPLLSKCPEKVLSRPLYAHQEAAIRKMVSGQRNIVVATGTGSGKTECFMLPICNHLLRQYEAGTLGPGVRALLLYPMNALANDQVKRLRDLLEPFEFVTFGRYTGETLKTRGEGLDAYRNTFNCDPLPNEMISREEMQTQPPHILITNYAMLEYLLLRPEDDPFFGGSDSDNWKFLVLDEAHTYTGVKGIETAMLIRRLKDRVVEGETGALQCVATSATLGRGLDDAPGIMEFASRLFSEDFEYDPADPSKQDLIVAEREPIDERSIWGRPDPQLYVVWRDILSQDDSADAVSRLAEAAIEHRVPNEVVNRAYERFSSSADGFLYGVMSGDEYVVRTQQLLAEDPLALTELAGMLFGSGMSPHTSEQSAVSLIGLAVRARPSEDSSPLLPARYHLMLKALGGAWLSFLPEPKVHLDQVARVTWGDKTAMAYEAGVCQKCGAPYILGARVNSDSGNGWHLAPVSADSNDREARYYAVLAPEDPSEMRPDEDEDPIAYDTSKSLYQLCPACGDIRRADSLGIECSCGVEKVRLLETKSASRLIGRCIVCGGQNTKHGIVRRVSSYPEAAASVIATSLYQELSFDESGMESRNGQSAPEVQYDEDGWVIDVSAPRSEDAGPQKLLVFSDSRQDAAYFAPYMQTSYDRMLRRNILLGAAREAIDELPDLNIMVPDLWTHAELKLRPVLPTGYDALVEAQKWVLYEFTGRDKHGLERLGLLGFELERPERWTVPLHLQRKWGLSESESWDLYQALLDTFRTSGAVSVPRGVDPEDELFEPGNLLGSLTKADRDRRYVKAWLPTSSSTANKRSDYLTRLAQQIGLWDDPEKAACDLLSDIWDRDLRPHNARSLWNDYFEPVVDKGGGVSYRLVPNKWRILAYGSRNEPKWYVCDKCGRLALRNIRGVCPQYRCTGRLNQADMSERLESNHYVRLYESQNFPKEMVSREHTAQLRPGAAAKSQTEFQEGRINVLSCSTTFELGVDLGDLEAVLMKNVPPSPSNYIQRAGRAGRRAGTAAMVVTYAQDRPHDAFHYRYPERMIKGHIKPPHFDINNEKIVLRHMYAVALADFWRKNRKYLPEVKNFFFPDDADSAVDSLIQYLDSRPESIRVSLERVVPDKLREPLGVDTWQWVDTLVGDGGSLAVARMEVENDIKRLDARYRELAAQRKKSDYVLRLIETMQKRYLLNYLSSKNVLPRYGFPVDVVTLETKNNHYATDDICLQRELKIAISEYAPDGEVVAGGEVWTSRYLERMPGKELPSYWYASCPGCGNHVTKLDVRDGDARAICSVCGREVECRESFIVPEFGFLVDPNKPAVAGGRRPQRTHSTRVFFSGIEDDYTSGDQGFNFPNGRVIISTSKRGKLTVINDARGAKFRVCQSCGYACIAEGKDPVKHHKNAYGKECSTKSLTRIALGHEFLGDIARIRFEPCTRVDQGFWYSLLYAMIEGACEALDIDRTEIDGCVQWGDSAGQPTYLILFDSVSGGVGHVQQLGREEALRDTLYTAYIKMASCTCGDDAGNGSCYSCLRNYTNQFCHDVLNRGLVVRFLKELGVEG